MAEIALRTMSNPNPLNFLCRSTLKLHFGTLLTSADCFTVTDPDVPYFTHQLCKSVHLKNSANWITFDITQMLQKLMWSRRQKKKALKKFTLVLSDMKVAGGYNIGPATLEVYYKPLSTKGQFSNTYYKSLQS